MDSRMSPDKLNSDPEDLSLECSWTCPQSPVYWCVYQTGSGLFPETGWLIREGCVGQKGDVRAEVSWCSDSRDTGQHEAARLLFVPVESIRFSTRWKTTGNCQNKTRHWMCCQAPMNPEMQPLVFRSLVCPRGCSPRATDSSSVISLEEAALAETWKTGS